MGRKKLLGVMVFLLALLIVPMVFSSAIVNMTGHLFSSNTAASASSSSTPWVFVDPVKVIDESLQPPSSTFTVHVNVSDVTDLFAWQINMTWDPSILSFSGIIPGEFLDRTTSLNKTSSAPRYFGGLGYVMNVTNSNGGITMAESILEDALPGNVPGVSTNGVNGTLVSIEFLVVGYGCTDLAISLSGNLPTTLLNSTILPNDEPGTISFSKRDGYFRNKLQGDADGNTVVDSADISVIIYYRSGPPPGPGGYDRNADIDDNGSIDSADISLVIANRGRSLPP